MVPRLSLSLRVSVSSHATASRPSFQAGCRETPCGLCSLCLDYSKTMAYDLVSVSVSVFEFAQIVLQVYRDKNLRFNLDLRTPSLSSLRLNLDLRTPSLSSLRNNLDLRNPRAFRVYALTSISATLSLSSVNIRHTPRG